MMQPFLILTFSGKGVDLRLAYIKAQKFFSINFALTVICKRNLAQLLHFDNYFC